MGQQDVQLGRKTPTVQLTTDVTTESTPLTSDDGNRGDSDATGSSSRARRRRGGVALLIAVASLAVFGVITGSVRRLGPPPYAQGCDLS